MQSQKSRAARSPGALKRAFAVAIAACSLSWAGTALARPKYPGELADSQKMPCVPTCMLCHTVPEGGKDRQNQHATFFFGAKFNPNMPLDGDIDGDEKSDGAELRAGTNPIIFGDVSVCIPEYGCGARIAPVPPDGSVKSEQWLFGALGLGVLLRWQLRRRAAGARSARRA